MFSKKQKIPRVLFPKHTDKKNSWNGVCLRICYYEQRTSEESKFAVVVAKKQYPNVVSRNLFKRRVFSSLRKNKDQFDQAPFKKYIVYPKSSVASISASAIALDITKFIEECLV